MIEQRLTFVPLFTTTNEEHLHDASLGVTEKSSSSFLQNLPSYNKEKKKKSKPYLTNPFPTLINSINQKRNC